MADLARPHIADAHPRGEFCGIFRTGRRHRRGDRSACDRRRRILRHRARPSFTVPRGDFIGRTAIRIG